MQPFSFVSYSRIEDDKMHTPSSLTMLLISSQPLDAKNLFFQGPKTRKNSFSRVHLGIHSYRLGEFLFKSKFLAMRFFNSVLSAIVKRFISEVCHRLLVLNTFCGRDFFCFSV